MNMPVSEPILNQDQQAAADELLKFIMGDEKEFSLSGAAGTGKTTMMHVVMRKLLPLYEKTCQLVNQTPIDYSVEITATTNKAAEVLAQATNKPTSTVHSYLGLKIYTDYKTGQTKITTGNDFKVRSKTILFIDEASMIDMTLYNYIHRATDKTCKIIYLGDRCQMAPVLEKLSPVYARVQNQAELTIQMRNSGQPALMALCEQLRANVDFKHFPEMKAVPGVIDYVDDAGAQAFIDQTFAIEAPSARILCYTNARVIEYNDYIRALRGYPDHPTPGEVVVNNAAAEIAPRVRLRVEEEFTIKKVDPKPAVVTVPHGSVDRPDVQIDVWPLVVESDQRTYKLNVCVPVYPEHRKELERYFKSIKDWVSLYWMRDKLPDFRPRDASTIYKAQGSTYDTAFLDLGNLGGCTDEDQLARMLYVGASRARERLVLYGELPARLRNRPHP